MFVAVLFYCRKCGYPTGCFFGFCAFFLRIYLQKFHEICYNIVKKTAFFRNGEKNK